MRERDERYVKSMAHIMHSTLEWSWTKSFGAEKQIQLPRTLNRMVAVGGETRLVEKWRETGEKDAQGFWWFKDSGLSARLLYCRQNSERVGLIPMMLLTSIRMRNVSFLPHSYLLAHFQEEPAWEEPLRAIFA